MKKVIMLLVIGVLFASCKSSSKIVGNSNAKIETKPSMSVQTTEKAKDYKKVVKANPGELNRVSISVSKSASSKTQRLDEKLQKNK